MTILFEVITVLLLVLALFLLQRERRRFVTFTPFVEPIEEYVLTRGGATAVSHGYCPECEQKLLGEIAAYTAGRVTSR